jgi:regulator of cell morphogenesis and NO signaling
MKMADLILANYQLLYVLPYFEIGLRLGESSVKQVCEKHGISVSFFLMVCNLYTFDDYTPDALSMSQIPMEDLIKYLRNSHTDYLETRMPKIIDKIMHLVDCCHLKNGEMLKKFCEKYRKEVITHFNYEEEKVFPYIESLLKKEKNAKYRIKNYESNHSNINVSLNDLKNIIIKYLPAECTVENCRDVLIDIFLFESDLYKHTLLEDRILISLVARIENMFDGQ